MKRKSILVLAAAILTLAPGLPLVRAADASDPEVQKLLMEAAKALMAQKPDDAVEAMKKVVKLVPDNDLFVGSLSDLERQSGKFADSLEHALQAMKLNEKKAEYVMLAANAAYSLHDLDRARELCDKVLKRGAEDAGASAFNDAKMISALLNPQTYTITWTLDPTKGQLTVPGNYFVIALPKPELPYQTATYEVTGALNSRIVRGDANDVMQIFPKGKQPITVITKVTVRPYSFKKEMEKPSTKPFPAEVRTFLGASESINPKSPAVAKVAAGLKGTNDVETARNVLEWMRKNIRYRLQKAGIGEVDFKTMDEIIERGHAECRGYTMLFTALCRAAGVPARPVWGLTHLPGTESKPKGDFASHNWCEVYVNGSGWVPVDPQKPETFGLQPTSNLRFFMDEKKNKALLEILPLANLLAMGGDTMKFE
jgi:tetratricopeptide (TPR) repeat protein